MNCQTFEKVAVDLARSVPLDASVRDAALAHCDGCTGCAGRLAQEQLLSGGLQALATEMSSAVVADRVEGNLLSVFREQAFNSQAVRSNQRWRYLAVAAVVILAVAMGIAGYRMRQLPRVDTQVSTGPPTETRSPNVSIAGVNESTTSRGVQPKPVPMVARKQRHRKVYRSIPAQSTFVSVVVGTVTDQETTEVVSPFMPVGYTNPANMQDGAQVVRVELPRYAMARFGVPVNMERYDERVKADVWLGTDGLARAIRFVQ